MTFGQRILRDMLVVHGVLVLVLLVAKPENRLRALVVLVVGSAAGFVIALVWLWRRR
ncbi:MAG TPA: hypothetical protein VHG09_02865 [Longimicrobiales bacterium]|nr:hypothetical protein [Longimicrobiales bacterium]